jgi:hypothetical protein
MAGLRDSGPNTLLSSLQLSLDLLLGATYEDRNMAATHILLSVGIRSCLTASEV